jgi:hypothetical protein
MKSKLFYGKALSIRHKKTGRFFKRSGIISIYIADLLLNLPGYYDG